MRVLSYNIHKGIGGRDRRYRIERIIRVIEEENPDLICLQEVDRNVRRTRFDDQPGRLSEVLHAVSLFQLNVHLKAGGYGNLILSRWPFRGHHQVSLRRARRKPRGAQLVVVERPRGAPPGQLAPRAQREGAALAGRPPADASPLPGVGPPADPDHRRHQRLAEHPGGRPLRPPRLRPRDRPPLAVPDLPRLPADGIARQGVLLRRRPHPARPRRPRPARRDASDHLPLVVDFHLG
jgi:endonuclease/exonuclease/phosphatase family metal-dependent hydrolase